MTSPTSKEIYDTLPPEVIKALLEGRMFLIHTVRVCVVREDAGTGIAIDTLRREDMSAMWVKTTQTICTILAEEFKRLPKKTQKTLIAAADLLPATIPLPLVQIDTWLSMRDDGGSWWDVSASLSPATLTLPDVLKASERAEKRVLQEVCKL
jgi:hypothetical protein